MSAHPPALSVPSESHGGDTPLWRIADGMFASRLTVRQREILDFIIEFRAEHGVPPTYRQIGAEFGIASTNGVSDHVHALIRKGYLTKAVTPLKKRVLRVVSP